MAEDTTPVEKTPVEKKAPAAKAASAAKAAPKKAAAGSDAVKAPAKAAAKTPKAEASGSESAAAEKKPASEKKTSAAAETVEATPVVATPRAGGKASTKSKAAPKAEAETRPQVLKMHHLRPAPGAKKDRMRVGRGEGSKGKTAGRGTKGTKARYSMRPGFEGGNINFIMRSPKLRGFKNPFRVEYQVVNLEKLAELYPTGGDVTSLDLVAKGAVRKGELVKVLGSGDIAVKLTVAVDKVSGSAEQKIVAAGGSVK